MTEATLAATGPNAEQITYWNDAAAEKWVRHNDLLDRQLGELGAQAMERAEIHAGERVIDVGCGCGATTLDLAGRVTASGSVLGVDISTPMLARARERAQAERLDYVRFENADAQTRAFPAAAFDLVYSRFGVMFFVDPEQAFANLRKALRPGGRMSFVCWRPLAENAWMAAPMRAAAQVIALPAPADPHAPGPFAFADPERVRRLLAGAGYAAIDFVPFDIDLTIADGSLDAATDFLMQLGPTARALVGQPADALPRVSAAIRAALEPFHGPQGVRMRFAAWMVRATNP